MPLPTRPGRVGRGCRTLTITRHSTEAHKEAVKDSGADHILSSIKFSKCELQPHVSRLTIRRMGSTDVPSTRESKTTTVKNNASSPGQKDESATMKVWKLLRPGLHRHLSLSGVSGKDGAIQLASKALMKKSTDRSLHYTGGAIIETAQEVDETLKQVEEPPVMALPEPVNRCDTVTLCGEA